MSLLGGNGDAATVQKAVDWLCTANSSYRSWCIPRMPGLTAEIVRCFFEKLQEVATENDERLATALLGRDECLPRSIPKLRRCEKELWASWGLLGKE